MTSKERFTRMFEHREADRIPIIDSPWAGTIARWKREGMPGDADWRDYFDVDKSELIYVDTSPRFEQKVLEETDRYRIITSPWGVTMKEFKEEDSTPEFLDFKVVTPEEWEKAKARMTLDRDRIDWKRLETEYPRWVAEGRWIEGYMWFGFDVTHSWMVGTETLLIAMLEQPEWVVDMFNTYLDRCIALMDMVWDAGYRMDGIFWPDDMGYKGTPFFSNATYRELLQPVQRRAVEWAHKKGIKAHLHSCGDNLGLLLGGKGLIPDLQRLHRLFVLQSDHSREIEDVHHQLLAAGQFKFRGQSDAVIGAVAPATFDPENIRSRLKRNPFFRGRGNIIVIIVPIGIADFSSPPLASLRTVQGNRQFASAVNKQFFVLIGALVRVAGRPQGDVVISGDGHIQVQFEGTVAFPNIGRTVKTREVPRRSVQVGSSIYLGAGHIVPQGTFFGPGRIGGRFRRRHHARNGNGHHGRRNSGCCRKGHKFPFHFQASLKISSDCKVK